MTQLSQTQVVSDVGVSQKDSRKGKLPLRRLDSVQFQQLILEVGTDIEHPPLSGTRIDQSQRNNLVPVRRLPTLARWSAHLGRAAVLTNPEHENKGIGTRRRRPLE